VLPESGPLYTWSQGECSTQIKHSIGAKVEISPKGFTLGIKTELQKILSICPKLLRNAELYDHVLAPRLEKGYQQICNANCNPSGQFSAFINILTSMF
jgi:hypothetical protein